MRGSVCTGDGIGKGLEGKKCDAMESSGGVLYEYGGTAGEGGRKFAYRSTRVRALAELQARISDHVANLSACRQSQLLRVFSTKNNSSGLTRESTLQLKRANVKRTKVTILTK